MAYIHTPQRFEQAGLRKGLEKLGVAATDVDALSELGGRGYLFVEFKTFGTELNKSQRVTFTRLLQDLNKPAFLIVASHMTEPEDDISQNAFVEEVYWRIPEVSSFLNYESFDTDYDGDLISLNHFVSEIVWTICPRLLTKHHELPAWDNRGPLPEMLKHWTEKCTDALQDEALTAHKRLGQIRMEPTLRESINSWTEDELADYLSKYGAMKD